MSCTAVAHWGLKYITREVNSRNFPLFYLCIIKTFTLNKEMCLEAHLCEQEKMNW